MKQTEIENIQVFVWSAIDVENKECLAIWVSKGRSSFETYVFLRKVLKYCKNRPEFVVDKGPWYPWAFKVLRLRYRHETFGSRNAVEGFFSKLKKG
ncbi:DDE-type integrase/transposase/recombinase [Methanothermococcus sp. SCGC AD-155-C09]|nr:DDE-type integrase/transposase/recombinase [Methanothermococcus sp. SCGC AD-155-C09]